jgi:hypothetical protein
VLRVRLAPANGRNRSYSRAREDERTLAGLFSGLASTKKAIQEFTSNGNGEGPQGQVLRYQVCKLIGKGTMISFSSRCVPGYLLRDPLRRSPSSDHDDHWS